MSKELLTGVKYPGNLNYWIHNESVNIENPIDTHQVGASHAYIILANRGTPTSKINYEVIFLLNHIFTPFRFGRVSSEWQMISIIVRICLRTNIKIMIIDFSFFEWLLVQNVIRNFSYTYDFQSKIEWFFVRLFVCFSFLLFSDFRFNLDDT